jgi:hypothetical protein
MLVFAGVRKRGERVAIEANDVDDACARTELGDLDCGRRGAGW